MHARADAPRRQLPETRIARAGLFVDEVPYEDQPAAQHLEELTPVGQPVAVTEHTETAGPLGEREELGTRVQRDPHVRGVREVPDAGAGSGEIPIEHDRDTAAAADGVPGPPVVLADDLVRRRGHEPPAPVGRRRKRATTSW